MYVSVNERGINIQAYLNMIINRKKRIYCKLNKNPKISIGIPVHNGDVFIRKCIESLLSQTFQNYEIIISDNASTDKTVEICQEYLKKDKRIKYFCQKENMGSFKNFHFILEKAKGEYFLFMAVDNYVDPTFLEKCINVLDTNQRVVGCISQMAIDNQYEDNFLREKKLLEKIGLRFRPLNTISITGSYNTRIRKFLRNFQWGMFYSVFRREELMKSLGWDVMNGFDATMILNMLKYGEIEVVNEILFYGFPNGDSSNGMIYLAKKYNKSRLGKILPYQPLSKWCLDNLGYSIFLRNFDHILRLNFDGLFLMIVGIYQNKLKNR
jgi:glycosyltransferase involved in cell wall biosynthesis